MKHPKKAKQRRWVIFNNGCVHGVQHSELTVIRSSPGRYVTEDSVSVLTISRTFALIAALAAATAVVLLLGACQVTPAQKGGSARTTITRPGHTNHVVLTQSENPKEPSRQTVQSEQTLEYVLPAGSSIGLASGGIQLPAGPAESGDNTPKYGSSANQGKAPQSNAASATKGSTPVAGPAPAPRVTAVLSEPMPVRCVTKDQTETSIGAAQKDTFREWAGKAAAMRPVMWAGIAMMTVVAGVFGYFGWWTKAALAVAVGLGMIVLAQTLPPYGSVILFGGLGLFAVAALLVLYAYHKGQLDQNHNGIPDIFEKTRDVPF